MESMRTTTQWIQLPVCPGAKSDGLTDCIRVAIVTADALVVWRQVLRIPAGVYPVIGLDLDVRRARQGPCARLFDHATDYALRVACVADGATNLSDLYPVL